MTIAASIAMRTLNDNRSVAMTASARRIQIHQPDRGPRVEQKLLHLLANVQADGVMPLAEVVNATLTQLRRGMTLCLITGSTDRTWIRGLSVLRRRGVGALVILLDRSSYVSAEPDEHAPPSPPRSGMRSPSTASSIASSSAPTTSPRRSVGGRARVSDLRERLRYPRAGWISLPLLGVMALALAWSVQGAAWLEQLDFLVPVALFAVVAGGLLGMLRTSIVWTLPVGALIGTAVVLWTIGGEYFNSSTSSRGCLRCAPSSSSGWSSCSARATRHRCRRTPSVWAC